MLSVLFINLNFLTQYFDLSPLILITAFKILLNKEIFDSAVLAAAGQIDRFAKVIVSKCQTLFW